MAANNIADLTARILMQVDGGQQIVQNLQLMSDLKAKAETWSKTSIFPIRSNTASQEFLSVARIVDQLTASYEKAYQAASLAGRPQRELEVLTASYAQKIDLLTKNFAPLFAAIDRTRSSMIFLSENTTPAIRQMALFDQAIANLDQTLLRRKGGFGNVLPSKEDRDALRQAKKELDEFATLYDIQLKRMLRAGADGSNGGVLARVRNALVPSGGGGSGGVIAPIDPQLANNLNAVGQLVGQLTGQMKALNDMMIIAKNYTKTLAEEEAKRAFALQQQEARARAAQEAFQQQASAQQRQAQAARDAAGANDRLAGSNAAGTSASGGAANATERQVTALQRLREALTGAQSRTAWVQGLSAHFSDAAQQLGQFASMATGPLGNALGRLATLSMVTSGGIGTAAAIGGLSALTIGVKGLFNEMVRVERAIGAVRELHVAIGTLSGEDGVRNFNELTGVMIKYGLSIENLSKPIARLKIATEGTTLGGERFKSFLEDFAAVGTKFALPQEAMAGMAKAFEQMISKGTVQAEEFRQQLGDRLPAAARIGLLTFREMTGNAKASFTDFMDAMKNRQIESTRFLDIFMIKLKETFGVTNDATNNLNAAYGRLEGARSVAINNLDRAIGVTKAWSVVLNGVASALVGVGNAADTAGPALGFLFGAAMIGGIVRVGMVLLPLLPPIRGIATGASTATAAVYGLLGVFTLFGAKGIASGLDGIYDKVMGISKAAGTFSSEKFKVNADFIVTGSNGTTKINAANLISEMSRYIAQANSGLKQGKKIEIDVDLTKYIPQAIEELRAKIGASQGKDLVPVLFDNGKLKEMTRRYEQFGDGIVTRNENLSARLNATAQKVMNAKILAEEDIYKRAELALQLTSARKSAQEIKSGQESIARLEAQGARFKEVYDRIAAVQVGATGGTDGFFTKLTRDAPILMSYLQQIANVLGIIAAARLLALVVGFDMATLAATRFGAMLTGIQRKLLVIGAAAAVLTFFSSGAKSAEAETDGLVRRLKELEGKLKADPNNAGNLRALGEGVSDADRNIAMLKQRLQELRGEQDSASKGWKDFVLSSREADEAAGRLNKTVRGFVTDVLPGQRPMADIKADIEAAELKLRSAEGAAGPLRARLEELTTESRAAGRAMESLGLGAVSAAEAMPSIGAATEALQQKLRTLKMVGLETYQVLEKVETIRGKFSGSTPGADATDAELTRYVRTNRELEDQVRRMQATGGKFKRMTAEQSDGIIQQADAIMEGFGKKTGAALRDLVKKVDDYTNALRANGMAQDEAKKKGEEYAEALRMQAAGINYAALQFKPYEAMQSNFVKFADGLVDMLGKGTLNAKSFGKAFGDMAMSIASDMLKMIIKANILRPLMQSIWNQGGSGLMGGMVPMESSNPFGSIFGGLFAKGDVFDKATPFGMAGGKVGIMGESGPEAVMPLKRGADGSLGVVVQGGGGGGSTYNVTYNVSTPDTAGFARSETQRAAMLARAADRGRRNS